MKRGLLTRLRAALDPWIPRTYVRVDHLPSGQWFIDTPASAMAIALSELDASDAPRRHLDPDKWLLGNYQLTFVRMTPRRFEAIPEFQGF